MMIMSGDLPNQKPECTDIHALVLAESLLI